MKNERFLKAIELVISLGFSLALPIVGGGILGAYLDHKFGLHPRLTLSFLFLGLFIAMASLYQQIKKFKI